jgi:Xaa-Pro aminopeptidase
VSKGKPKSDARFSARRDRLRRVLAESSGESLLVTNPVNVRYLTGFTGEDSYLLLSRKTEFLVSDARFEQQLSEECPELKVVIRPVDLPVPRAAAKLIRESRLAEVGVEAQSVSLWLIEQLQSDLPSVQWRPWTGAVEELRQIKDASEVREIERAIRLAEKAISTVIDGAMAESSEERIAAEIEYQIRRLGGRGCSFSPIVAVGARSALPHAPPTKHVLSDAEFVLVDWGARGDGYVSDLTRVFCLAPPTAKFRRIYEVVLRAQRRAIRRIRPGVTLKSVDRAARSVIEDAGYKGYFKHSLGHGIGLEVHEPPRVGPGQDQKLQAGMVVTVEPGIYLPGWGGIRIEDDVLVTRDGYRILSRFPVELDECTMHVGHSNGR